MSSKIIIQDVYSITGIGVVPVGNVTQGTFRIGMKCNINGTILTVKTIEMHHQQLKEVGAGSNIGFSLGSSDKNLLESVKNQELEFFDENEEQIKLPIVNNSQINQNTFNQNNNPGAIHPKGIFNFITKFFRKN
jgi:translation elongation factor EF-1alpha